MATTAGKREPVAEELRRQNEELAALHETALGLVDRLDLDSVLEAIVARASALVGTRHGYLYLPDPVGDVLTSRVATGIFASRVGYVIGRGEGVGGRVWETGEPLVVRDYRRWRGRRTNLDELNIRAVAGVPLCAAGEVVGVLGLAHLEEGRRFGPGETALLERFARLASLALENARLYTTAQQELAERRETEEELLDAVARFERAQHELELTREETIRRLAYAAEFRDADTGRHVERMSRYCALLVRQLGLDEERCELLRMASPLHDVGKIGISDRILGKPGALTPDERREIERHAEIGHAILSGSGSELLELAATIALTHHERYDGVGYPRGLIGEAIPLEGRIAAVADVFDALTSDRVYRPAFPLERALAMLEEGRGTQFDPLVLDVFFGSIGEILAIAGGRAAGLEGRDGEAQEPAPSQPAGRRGRERPAGGGRELPLGLLELAAAEAEAALREVADDRGAIDAALARLCEVVGRDVLLTSVYVCDHDRLWCLAQQGYEEVRDGFALEQGVIARALRTGRPQYLADVSRDPDYIAGAGGLLSELAVPFGDGLGVLNVETRRLRLPAGAEPAFERLAQALAELAGAIRGHLGLDLASLARLFVHASSLRGVGAIAEFATRTLGRLLDLEAAQLSLGRQGTGYALASFWRRPGAEIEPLAPAYVDRLAGLVEAGHAAYTLLDRRTMGLPPAEAEARPWLVWLPLEVVGSQVGVLAGLAAHRPSVEPARVEAATLFAPHAAALIDVAQALRREQRAAVTDSLTGLLNRRGLEQRLREEIERAERAGRELAVAILDCDGLKSINDRDGHEAGDAVLLLVARCLRASKRAGDVAARLGGDEFVLLLPEVDAEGAQAAAERIRLNLASAAAEHGGAVTATLGVAVYPADGSGPSDVLGAADRALCRAKRNGGNQTALAERIAAS